MATSSGIEAAEYVSLRSEILKLSELQSQLITVLLVAFGAVSSIAIQGDDANLAFSFPLFAGLLGIIWMNHAHAIERCAALPADH